VLPSVNVSFRSRVGSFNVNRIAARVVGVVTVVLIALGVAGAGVASADNDKICRSVTCMTHD